jgi:hypothetical protein
MPSNYGPLGWTTVISGMSKLTGPFSACEDLAVEPCNNLHLKKITFLSSHPVESLDVGELH